MAGIYNMIHISTHHDLRIGVDSVLFSA